MVVLRYGAALLVAAMASVVSPSARAQTLDDRHAEVGAVKDAPPVSTATTDAFRAPSAWPPPMLYKRRSTGLLVTGISLASIGATVLGFGVAIYGTASDSCLDQVHGSTSGDEVVPGTARKPDRVRTVGLFCTADRSQFHTGMGMMVVGGALFSLGVPVAVFGGSSAATSTSSGLTVSPRGVGYVVAF